MIELGQLWFKVAKNIQYINCLISFFLLISFLLKEENQSGQISKEILKASFHPR